MKDEQPSRLTIGQLAERTAVAVPTIRYWSDIGVLPPEGRTEGGYRLYGAEAIARLELVRTLRELGLGLDAISQILESEATIAEVAARHVVALDARIGALKVNRAVLATVAKRGSTAKETALMNKLARLSVDERRKIIEDFLKEVAGGLEAGPDIGERLSRSPLALPENPTAEQVDAWLELAELIQDPGFRARMRTLLELSARGRNAGGSIWFAGHVVQVVGEARERGVAPDAPEAFTVLSELFGDADRRTILQCLEVGLAAGAERYRQLISVVRGHQPRPSRADDYTWLGQALRADLQRAA
ncbi:MerR family transcriptional regulator [Streptomyces cavernae]|uniref:helix-turn-helix domain-containing protein n=1 Tax=Streptomyces cavernae TaxID=2259034 RepID=UPI000FEB900B|nr:MerR family transcriptional regulator [Streptomyces cavernae]